MIVWLASYPRSGNALLRTVLKTTMGLTSYSRDSDDEPLRELDPRVFNLMGAADYTDNFPDFYRRADRSDELVLIKTHAPPRDGNPAIYVVRDGRAAICSFLKFERSINPHSPITMLDLILGNHHYGDWSWHYNNWHNPDVPGVFTLKFEELVHATQEDCQKIADFLGFKGTVMPWNNPFHELKALSDVLFQTGKTSWTAPPEWDAVCDAAFWIIHFQLMQQLGWVDQNLSAVDGPFHRFDKGWLEDIARVVRTANTAARGNRMFERESTTRLAMMNHLEAVCKERLDYIEALRSECARPWPARVASRLGRTLRRAGQTQPHEAYK